MAILVIFILATLLALAIRLAYLARLRARDVQAAHAHLIGEMRERKRAQDALHQSEEMYRLLFEANPQPMWVYDQTTLAFLMVNKAPSIITGTRGNNSCR